MGKRTRKTNLVCFLHLYILKHCDQENEQRPISVCLRAEMTRGLSKFQSYGAILSFSNELEETSERRVLFFPGRISYETSFSVPAVPLR